MRLLLVCLISALMSCFPAYGANRTKGLNYPMAPQRVQYGVASWYGGRNQGRLMACGEPFDQYSMVAAHRTLPLGTRVRVTNLRNGRSVVVRIMDRGPAVAGRVIDLSKAAASRLRFTHGGLTPVKIRVLSVPGKSRPQSES
jgi:rare lipoprotein A